MMGLERPPCWTLRNGPYWGRELGKRTLELIAGCISNAPQFRTLQCSGVDPESGRLFFQQVVADMRPQFIRWNSRANSSKTLV